ncbi:hypothetical protein J6590_008158 [Homalodisca vitripennis]|nr:hypothetical protein J6590_008158 [Homalodisca vitripennis]
MLDVMSSASAVRKEVQVRYRNILAFVSLELLSPRHPHGPPPPPTVCKVVKVMPTRSPNPLPAIYLSPLSHKDSLGSSIF